jgi:UDP-glucose 4-epimerase
VVRSYFFEIPWSLIQFFGGEEMSNHKTVLVTGVAGFIGRYVARLFVEQTWQVIGIDSSSPENAPLLGLAEYRSLRLPSGDLPELLQKYAPDLCIHCAGRAAVALSVKEPLADFYANTVLTMEMLDTLRRFSPQCKFIFLSSAAVYGNPVELPISELQACVPVSPYGFHKLQSEQLCKEFHEVHGLATASARIFSAYGAGLRRQVLWDICYKALTEKVVSLQGTGQESRDFIHVSDIARALMSISEVAPMCGEVYNLAAGREVKIVDLAQMVLGCLDYEGELRFGDTVPVGVPLNWRADVSNIFALGFSPQVTLDSGINNFVTWCKLELQKI